MGNARGPDLLTVCTRDTSIVSQVHLEDPCELNAPSHGAIERINTRANKENIPPERLEAHASITSLSTDSELTMVCITPGNIVSHRS